MKKASPIENTTVALPRTPARGLCRASAPQTWLEYPAPGRAVGTLSTGLSAGASAIGSQRPDPPDGSVAAFGSGWAGAGAFGAGAFGVTAFDAMGSDRVYRKGMTPERVDAIIEGGAGRQWDPTVVAAFFRVRDDIRDIIRRERDQEVPELANLFLP